MVRTKHKEGKQVAEHQKMEKVGDTQGPHSSGKRL